MDALRSIISEKVCGIKKLTDLSMGEVHVPETPLRRRVHPQSSTAIKLMVMLPASVTESPSDTSDSVVVRARAPAIALEAACSRTCLINAVIRPADALALKVIKKFPVELLVIVANAVLPWLMVDPLTVIEFPPEVTASLSQGLPTFV